MQEDAIRILVVDDNTDAADSIAMMFQVAGYAVKVLYDSREALVAIDDFRPHVGVFDIGMPHISGYDLARKVRHSDAPAHAVVAVSGWGTERDKEEAHKAGFDHHFTKPADPTELIAYVRERCLPLLRG